MRSATMLYMHFKGKNINVVIHVRDFNAQGDGIYVKQNEEKEEEHFPMQSPCSFMQKLLGEDNVPNDNQDVQQMNIVFTVQCSHGITKLFQKMQSI